MLRYRGDGFHNHTGSMSKDGPAIAANGSNLTIDDRIADGVHVALCRREGGFPTASIGRVRLLADIDRCVEDMGTYRTRLLLLQAARALR